jgi:uncharacterized damage-inducible protein DinB
MRRPTPLEAADFYSGYIDKVPGNDFLQVLKNNASTTLAFLSNLTPIQWDYRYAPDKWSIKEMILHIIDSERIFTYRALRIARGDQTPLPGFEQNDYVPLSKASERSAESIISEYQAVRNASLALFTNFDDDMLHRKGTASETPITVLALGFIVAGHELHHLNILKERYL